MLRRGFQPSRLGVALVVMINLASEVWILLLDDLSSVIFRHPTTAHTILCEWRYFSNLIADRTPLKTILGLLNLIEGSERPISGCQMVVQNLPLNRPYSHPVPK